MQSEISPVAARGSALSLLVLLAGCGGVIGSPEPALTPAEAASTITASDMARRIGAIAHDSTMGRDTPSPELEEVAAYLVEELRTAGLEPAGTEGGYVHRYDYVQQQLVADETVVGVVGAADRPTYAVDYFMVPPPAPREAPAHFVGVAGEVGAPPQEARGKVLVYAHRGAELDQEWQTDFSAALQAAAITGAPGVMVVLDPAFPEGAVGDIAAATATQQAPMGVVGITYEAGSKLLAELGHDLDALASAGIPTPLGDRTLEMKATRTEVVHTPPNVAAVLPGTDPELRETYVVLTAHFDHVGVGRPDESGDSIFNGADDDASGTAAVLEVAEAFAALGGGLPRSVLFLLVSGEEKGLLGSTAWVESPTVGLDGVVANINLDMIGRNAPDTLIGIGQEYSTLEGTLQQITDARPELGLNVILDPVPEEHTFFRSDQLPFIKAGVPAVFFTTGEHEDYHEQSDEAEAIDNDKAARVARLAFFLAHALATSPEAPDWTEEGRAAVEEILRMSPF